MMELYMVVIFCVIAALLVGFLAVTMYLVWEVLMHDLDHKNDGGEEE